MTHTPDKQRAIAEAATQGEWTAKIWRHTKKPDTVCIQRADGDEIVHWAGFDGVRCTKAEIRADARHIATFDPPTILAMLDELAADKARIAGLEAALKLALTRMAHKAVCHRTRPSEEWLEHGSADFSGCDCEMKVARAALEYGEPGS